MSRSTRMLTLAAGTALASLALAGCTTKAAPRAELSASNAQVALKKGKVTDAIAQAEAAVLADPRNAAYRTLLGAAYMEAGRFQSARTSFDDALDLGDESARTALGFALAAIATGDRGGALEVLDEWRDDIPAADLGLALALAGDTAQAVHVLSNAVRDGDNTPKSRQNLAYALALDGNWAAARIMAAEDVSPDQLDSRLSEWARMAQAEHGPTRVAALIGTRVADDSGQPAQLALANHPSLEQLAVQATEAAPAAEAPVIEVAAYTGGELPALASTVSPIQPIVDNPASEFVTSSSSRPTGEFQAAFAENTPTAATPAQMLAAAVELASQPVVEQVARAGAESAPAVTIPAQTLASAVDFVSDPVVQHSPVSATSSELAPFRVPPRVERTFQAPAASGTHLVQLGSFSSEAGARRAWGIYEKQFPQLAQYNMVITKAVVRGKTYFRVSAGGLSRAAASSACSAVRSKRQGCFAWAEGRPMPGAVPSGVRMARH